MAVAVSKPPIRLKVDLQAIPAELKARRCWTLWKKKWEPSTSSWGKVPCNGSGRPWSPQTKPTDRLMFEDAVTAYKAAGGNLGLGVATGDGLVGVDLDHAVDDEGNVAPWARDLIGRLPSYTEISPSGRGVRILLLGAKPEWATSCRQNGFPGGGHVEIYDHSRFVTVTGDVRGEPRPLIELEAELADLCREYWPEAAGENSPAPEPEKKPTQDDPAWQMTHTKGLVARDGGTDAISRASSYLARCEPAISGQNGHTTTLETAMKVGPGFDLTEEEAYQLLLREYNPRCEPPWELKDLRRKVSEAYKLTSERGWLLNADGANGSDRHGGRGSGTDGGNGPPRHRYALTDLGLAERFVDQHGANVRFCHPWSKWLVYDGRRWAEDDTAAVRRLARSTVRSIYAEASAEEDDALRKALATHAKASEDSRSVGRMLKWAEALEGVPVLPGQMDSDPWLLNVANGTLDLRTGELREHRRVDLITKLCDVVYDPDATCTLWEETLELVFDGNQELIDYWWRISGMSIAGKVRDHMLPIAYGKGSNGKSTTLGTLLDTLGTDYAMKAAPDLLMTRKGESHPTDRCDLFGKRLVVAIETEEGRRINETLVKELSGGDKIRARRMREDFWEFSPTHTLILATNHKPTVRGTDHGIWRRLRLVPFTVEIPDSKADKAMPEKLATERAGILAWCVRGCLEWQRSGLPTPEIVKAATSDYKAEQDTLGAFLEQETIRIPGARVKAGALFSRYRTWMEAANERALNLTLFGRAMEERGIKKEKGNVVKYVGIGLRDETKEQSAPAPEPVPDPDSPW